MSRLVSDAESETVSFYLAEAATSLKKAVDALGCSEHASAEQVARLFLIDGMVAHFQKDDAEARISFAVARELAPELWNHDFGEKARAIYESAESAEGAPTRLVFHNLGGADQVRVDGRVQGRSVRVEPGRHLLQVGPGPARFARVLDIPPGAVVEINLPEIVPEYDADNAVVTRTTRSRPILPEHSGGEPRGWVAAVLTGGFGGSGQTIRRPGTFLDDDSSAGAVVGAATFGSLPIVGPVGVQWDVGAPVQLPTAHPEVQGGLSASLGAVSMLGGVAVQSITVVEGGEKRSFLAMQPQIGALYLGPDVPLDVSAMLGWSPSTTQARARAGYSLVPMGPVALRIGADLAWYQAHLIEENPGARRATAGVWRAAGQVGLAWRS